MSRFLEGLRPWADYRRQHQWWISTAGEPQWIRRTGKPYLLDGSTATLDPEFDWQDETWVAFYFETHGSIGMDPYDSRPLLDLALR
jgi:hypothetical protein